MVVGAKHRGKIGKPHLHFTFYTGSMETCHVFLLLLFSFLFVTYDYMASIILSLGGIHSLRETPERRFGLENGTRTSIDIEVRGEK